MMSFVPEIFKELLGLLACSVEMMASSAEPGVLLHVVQLVFDDYFSYVCISFAYDLYVVYAGSQFRGDFGCSVYLLGL